MRAIIDEALNWHMQRQAGQEPMAPMDRIAAIIGSYERAWSLYSSLLKKDIGQADAYLACMPPDGRTYALFQAAPWDIERMHPIVRLQGVMRAVRAVAGQYAGFAAQQPEPGSSKALAVKAMIEHIGVIEANNALSLVDGQHHEIDTQPALEALKEMAPLAYREYEKRVLQQGSSIADWEQVKQKYPAEAERLNHNWHEACHDRAAAGGGLTQRGGDLRLGTLGRLPSQSSTSQPQCSTPASMSSLQR